MIIAQERPEGKEGEIFSTLEWFDLACASRAKELRPQAERTQDWELIMESIRSKVPPKPPAELANRLETFIFNASATPTRSEALECIWGFLMSDKQEFEEGRKTAREIEGIFEGLIGKAKEGRLENYEDVEKYFMEDVEGWRRMTQEEIDEKNARGEEWETSNINHIMNGIGWLQWNPARALHNAALVLQTPEEKRGGWTPPIMLELVRELTEGRGRGAAPRAWELFSPVLEELKRRGKSTLARILADQFALGSERHLDAEVVAMDGLSGTMDGQSDDSTDSETDLLAAFNSIIDPAVELIKNRFLCRGGAVLVSGSTGVGKSSLAGQFVVGFGVGMETLGLNPATAMRSWWFNAENDAGDMREILSGVVYGLADGDEQLRKKIEAALADSRVFDWTAAGWKFLEKLRNRLLRAAAEGQTPDLVIVDPVFAFLGGDANDNAEVGQWLRGGLVPLARQYGFGVILVHHLNKSTASDTGAGAMSLLYGASGAGELVNLSRAVLTLTPTNDGEHLLNAPKRGSRLGWRSNEGETVTTRKLKRSTDGKIFWIDAGAMATRRGAAAPPVVCDVAAMCREPAKKTLVVAKIQEVVGCGRDKARDILEMAIDKGDVFQQKAFASPAVYVCADSKALDQIASGRGECGSKGEMESEPETP